MDSRHLQCFLVSAYLLGVLKVKEGYTQATGFHCFKVLRQWMPEFLNAAPN